MEHIFKYLILLSFFIVSCNVLKTPAKVTTSGPPEPPPAGCVARSQPNKFPDLNIPASPNPVCNGWHPSCAFIQSKYDIGEAAGNAGDIYQNIDNNHARAGIEAFPQVEEMTPLPSGQFGYLANLPNWNRKGSVVIANGSYVVGNAGGTYSTPRYYFHRPRYFSSIPGVERAMEYYEYNVHQWHPEHQDFDDYNKFFTHLTAIGVSQGSSGSELDEILHQYAILASFKPNVKDWLRSRGLIMPVMLMAHRWGRASGLSNVYLSGQAHPGAMDDVSGSSALTMATTANSITLDTIPPFSKISVISESFSENNSEKIFDNYLTISRIFSQAVNEQVIEVSAEDSFDVNCLPLSYTWKVLGGEFDSQNNRLVTMEQVQQGTFKKMRIRVKKGTFIAPGTASTTSKMIYIGLFVHNGYYYSLPSIISISSDSSLVPF